MRITRRILLPLVFLCLIRGGSAYGQAGGGPQFDPAAMQQFMTQVQQRMLDNLKTQMGSSDDEFAALQPMIQKIMQIQMTNGMSRIGRMFGGGAATFNFGQPPTEVQKAAADLQAAVDDQGSNPNLIANKLAALRAARQASEEELAKAQADLQQLLTQRQEAVLVLAGVLN